MINIVAICKRIGLVSAAILTTIAFTPIVALADGSQCTPPPSNQAGVNRPVGADAGTYTYDCPSGLWLNAHYSFNPATGQYTALDPAVYTYNSTSGKYDTTTWVYNAPSHTYVPVTQSVVQPPAGANVVGGPPAPAPSAPATGSDSISNIGPGSNNTINDNGGVGSGSISNTGPNSNNSLGGSSTSDLTGNNTTNANVGNALNSTVGSGNAIVIGNTTGGNATSGDAQAIANVVNMLQSSSSALGGKTVTFVANLNGDVNGDLLINPAALGTVQSANTAPTVGNNNLTLNNQTNAAINNNINLASTSGDATVADNTTGGNATSGSAEAIANVVNLIDSAISSGNSFIGVININGNFNGNILVPPDLVNQLIASNVPTVTISNTGPDSNNTINKQTGSNTTTVNNTNNEGINNTVNSTAASGQAGVTNNTSAGNATTGNANSSVTAFNLTGSNVIGSNDLLVFVNVLGQWVGMIVNAPSGATAAELGGGITQNSTEANNSTTINNKANEQINNNITTSAQSGNASVDSNTKGGNATSGKADTAVNLLNVENSNLSFSGWFGILFINVFGTWNGNFGIAPITGPGLSGSTASSSSTSGGGTPATFAAFRFAPNNGSSGSSTASGAVTPIGSISNTGPGSNNTIASHQVALRAPTPALASGHASYVLPLMGCILFGLYIAADVTHTKRQRHAQKA